MANDFQLRREAEGDADGIRRVHSAAFETPLESRLVDLLRERGRLRLSIVVLADEKIIGHIAYSPVTVDGVEIGWGLAPFAVAPGHQGRGAGSRLIRESLAACRGAEIPLVVVLGEPAYYGRFGFRPASELGLVDRYGGGDAFQTLMLRDDLPPCRGVVHYAPEFDLFA